MRTPLACHAPPCSRRVPRSAAAGAAPLGATHHPPPTTALPYPAPRAARVTKIIKLNGDLLKISRDACFLTARVTELFLERAVVDAAGTTSKAGRKTVTLRDIVTSMRGHPNPEALQAFVGAAPPRPPPRSNPNRGPRALCVCHASPRRAAPRRTCRAPQVCAELPCA